MTDPLLIVRWMAPGLHRVVSVHPDEAWVWSLSGSAPWADRAGTFAAPVRPSDHDTTLDLADQVRQAPEPRAHELALLVSAGPVTRRVGASSTLAGRLMELLTPLVDHALANPVSAFAAGPPGVPMPPGVAMLGVSFRSLGAQSVTFSLAPSSLRAHLPDGRVVVLEAPRMGLVDASTHLIDGIHGPAVLAPGAVAGWALPAPPGARPVRLGLAGSVRLVGPWPEGLPDARFEVDTTL